MIVQRTMTNLRPASMAFVFLATLSIGVAAWSQAPQPYVPTYTEQQLEQMVPTSPDPRVSLLPQSVVPDHDYWNSFRYWKTVNAPTVTAANDTRALIILNEIEDNNTQSNATPVPLGNEAIGGNFQDVIVEAGFQPLTFVQTFITEDNGSILSATPTSVGVGNITAALSQIGNGPHGSAGSRQGDVDFFATEYLPGGVFLEVQIDTFDNSATLQTFVTLWNSQGEVIDYAPKIFGDFGGDPSFAAEIDDPGIYYISVGARKTGTAYSTLIGGQTSFFTIVPLTENIPESPFMSGTSGGFASEGDYNITIRVTDVDIVRVDLEAGDVLGIANVPPLGDSTPVIATRLEDSNGTLLIGSTFSGYTSYFPAAHPFTPIRYVASTGNFPSIQSTYLIDQSGPYYITFLGSSPESYRFDLRVRQPRLEGIGPSARQAIYLTYSGVSTAYGGGGVSVDLTAPITVNPSVWDEFARDRDIQISPLMDFVGNMGLPADEMFIAFSTFSLINAIENTVRSNFLSDPSNPNSAPIIDILRGPKPSPANGLPLPAAPNSAEIFIGGAIAETGISTIGIAEFIDPGNYANTDRALVMLDEISANIPPFTWLPSDDQDIDDARQLAARIDLLGTIIGNVVAHEAGHFLGNFHTNPENFIDNIMDAGGTSDLYQRLAGSGFDGIFNTFDDVDVRFGLDFYDPFEGFSGVENTDSVIRIGVNAAGFAGDQPITNLDNVYVDYNSYSNGIGTPEQPFDKASDAVTLVNPGGTVNIFAGDGAELFQGANKIDTEMTLRNENPENGVVRIGDTP